jgi:hypothetical protein
MTGKIRSSATLRSGRSRLGLGGLFFAGTLSLLAGCVTPLKPYLFTAPPMARDPIEALAAAFGQHQILAIIVDPQAGLVQSRWNDTGVAERPLDGQKTTIVRRYSATLTRGRNDNEVALSLDEQRCVVGQFTLAELEVRGRCEPLVEVPPQHRDEWQLLGRRLQQAMSIP